MTGNSIRLGSGHCCACNIICHHVGPARYCEDHKPVRSVPSAPVVVPMPSRLLRPCGASVQAVLGFAEPMTIPCGLAAGHTGNHRYSIEWPADATT
jgi:hypothetical protein